MEGRNTQTKMHAGRGFECSLDKRCENGIYKSVAAIIHNAATDLQLPAKHRQEQDFSRITGFRF